jgi:hypothetical protein
MILDTSGFSTRVNVQLTDVSRKEYNQWASDNDTEIRFSFGKIYFNIEEDAVAFKLRFGGIHDDN